MGLLPGRRIGGPVDPIASADEEAGLEEGLLDEFITPSPEGCEEGKGLARGVSGKMVSDWGKVDYRFPEAEADSELPGIGDIPELPDGITFDEALVLEERIRVKECLRSDEDESSGESEQKPEEIVVVCTIAEALENLRAGKIINCSFSGGTIVSIEVLDEGKVSEIQDCVWNENPEVSSFVDEIQEGMGDTPLFIVFDFGLPFDSGEVSLS